MSDGLESIIEQIEDRVEEERESVLDEARKEAEEKKSSGEKEAEKEKEKILEEGKSEADRISRRITANARREAGQKKLEVREEVIQEVFDKVEEELADFKGCEEYNEVLKDLIIQGGITVGGGDLEVLILEEDEEKISKDELEDMKEEISNETGKDTSLEILTELEKEDGGAIVRKSDGSVSCNNTFKARLDRQRSSIRSKIAGILFEE